MRSAVRVRSYADDNHAASDLFEGGAPVLLVANEETGVDIYRSYLPSEAKQGDVLRLEVVVNREEI